MPVNLITGGAGFIGSHLAEYLLNRGENVIILDNLSTGRFDNIRHLAGTKGFSYIIADLTENEYLENAVAKADLIYHLAAAVGVQLIVENPVHTIETNIECSARLLRLAARTGKKVLITSTSEVYGKNRNVPFKEDDDTTYGPTSKSRWSYAFSKAVDEFLATAYYEEKGLPVTIVRLFNTVGPRQVGYYGMVIPRFIEQGLKGGPITVYGNGQQSRCFCHVLDIVPALYALMNCSQTMGKVINLGTEEEVTINELAEKVRLKINPAIEIRHIPYDQAYRPGFEDMQRRVPCIERARKYIQFKTMYSLDDILRDIIDWQTKTS